MEREFAIRLREVLSPRLAGAVKPAVGLAHLHDEIHRQQLRADKEKL
jgi:hypothetical protein